MRNIKKAVAFLMVLTVMLTPACFVAQAKGVSQASAISKVISVAENEVGYQGTGTYSKYGEWYGYQGGWCTTFVLWCFNKAGNALGVKLYGSIVPSGGNCNSMISWYQNKGRYHTRSSGYTPKKGDLVFFDWSGNGSSQHVGIVNGISGSTVYTIEGNCSGAVKERTYTTSGSKPYNNISAIMGYGAPNWGAVTGGGAVPTTSPAATKKPTTSKRAAPNNKPSEGSTGTTAAQSTPSDAAAGEDSTSVSENDGGTVMAEDMTLYAAASELQVGDSVQLDYSIEPVGAVAVVGYFCDEENVIELSKGGLITATGEGTATVVVCANDEIYKQCDFTVTEATGDVTRQYTNRIIVQDSTTQGLSANKSKSQLLNDWGSNIDKLASHKDNYKIPLCIVGATAFVSAMIWLVKAVKKKTDRKNNPHKDNDSKDNEKE